MNVALFVALPVASGSLHARMSPSNPYYFAYVILGGLLLALVIGLRRWRGDKITWSILGKGLRHNLMEMKKGDANSPLNGSEVNLAVLNQIGNLCPICGAVTGAEAIVCPHCGTPVPKTMPETSQPQPEAGIAQEAMGEARKCPSCGTMVAAGMDTCPDCNWRLRKAAAAAGSNPHIGIVQRDVVIGGMVAFKKDEWVNIEYESPDPARPEYKYIVRSRTLDKRFRLSDRDLSK